LALYFQIVNPSPNLATQIALNGVKVRYYFNATTSPLGFTSVCDSASVSPPYSPIKSEVTITPGASPGATAQADNGTYYLEFAFSAATQSIPGAGGLVNVQARFFPSSYASGTFSPTTDYSYLAGDGGYVANPKMTATLGGTLVWGQTP
jgi:hypothetical protein